MGWLRKAERMPADTTGVWVGQQSGNGPVQSRAFLDFIGGPNNPLYPEPSFLNNADYGFDKNELAYACIMEKATSLPDAPFRVFGPDGQGEPRENHPLRQLIANPNPATTEFELIEMTSIHLDLAGVAFWEIVTNRLGQPVELWLLRPDLVRIFPRQNGNHEYGYSLGAGSNTRNVIPLGTNVLKFTLPNPTDPILGQAPMRPANRAVALDNEATDFVKALLQNRAVPGTVIETEQKIDEALTERLTSKWIERFGRQNRGQPAFLQKGMKVHTLGLNLGELEFPDLRTISESRICAAFGVPPILVGAKVGLDRSTFANYAEARRSFWEETLMPLQKRMQQIIVSRLMPMVEGPRPRRSVARFDNSEVMALRESEANRWEKGTQALRAGGLLVNDFRRYIGLPTIEGGDVFLVPAGVTPVEDLSNMPKPEPPTPPADPASEDPMMDEPPDEPGSQNGNGQNGNGQASNRWTTFAKQVPQIERDVFAHDVANVVERQREEIVGRLTRGKTLLEIAPQAYKATDLWDGLRWDRELAKAMEPHMQRIARTAAHKVDGNEPVAIMDNYITVASRNIAARWNTETEDQISGAVQLGGSDVIENVDNVFAIAAGARATRLASSVATDMNGFGKVDTAKRVGLTTKTWVTGANPRPEHDALDGESVAVSEPFSNGDMWPTGMNCNCDVEFSSEGI